MIKEKSYTKLIKVISKTVINVFLILAGTSDEEKIYPFKWIAYTLDYSKYIELIMNQIVNCILYMILFTIHIKSYCFKLFAIFYLKREKCSSLPFTKKNLISTSIYKNKIIFKSEKTGQFLVTVIIQAKQTTMNWVQKFKILDFDIII